MNTGPAGGEFDVPKAEVNHTTAPSALEDAPVLDGALLEAPGPTDLAVRYVDAAVVSSEVHPGARRVASYPPDFKAVYDAYPNKASGPTAAYRVWQSAMKRPNWLGAGEVMAGLERWKRSEQWSKPDPYIKHMTTWLNQSDWEGHPEPWTGQAKGTKTAGNRANIVAVLGARAERDAAAARLQLTQGGRS